MDAAFIDNWQKDFEEGEKRIKREFIARYNHRDPSCVKYLQEIDPNFEVHRDLSAVDKSTIKYLWRCEKPSNHFVSFTAIEVAEFLPPHCHEFIDGSRPYRMFFDIEHEFGADELRAYQSRPNYVGLDKLFEGLLGTLIAHFKDYVGQKGRKGYGGKRREVVALFGRAQTSEHLSEHIALVSHRLLARDDSPIKFSSHLIFPNFIVANHHAAKHVAEGFRRYLAASTTAKKAAGWLDLAVYKSGMSFRVAGSTKLGEYRPLVPFQMRHKPEDYTTRPYDLVQQGVVSSFAIAIPVDYKIKVAAVAEDPAANFKAEVMAKNIVALQGYSYDARNTTRNGIYPLCCVAGTQCLIAKRAHASTSRLQYILHKSGKAFFGCSHSECRKRFVKLEYGTNECETVIEHSRSILRGMDIIQDGPRHATTIMTAEQFIGAAMVEEFRHTSVLAVSSAMGTGKTFGLKSILDEVGRENVIMISFRKAFTAEKAAQLGLASYNGEYAACKEFGTIKGTLESGLIIQAEALTRLDAGFVPKLLILDEMESILSQFAGHEDARSQFLARGIISRMRKGIGAATVFHRLVRNTCSIISLDANLTNNSVRYLAKTSGKSVKVILNNYKHSGKAYIYGSEEQVIFNLMETIKAGKKAAFVSDSKSEIDAARALVAEVIGEANCYISTGANIEQRAEDIYAAGGASQLFDKYQFIAYNTTLLAGIDIHNEGRDTIFACFQNDFITPFMAMQLLGRLRNIAEIHFHARDGRKKGGESLLVDSYGLGIDFADKDTIREVVEQSDALSKAMAKHIQIGFYGVSEMRSCMLALLLRHGFEIRNLRAAGHISLRESRVAAKAEDSLRILEAVKTVVETRDKIEEERAAGEITTPKVRMSAYEYKAAVNISELFGIDDRDISELTAEEIDQMRGGKAMECQKHINIVKGGWNRFRNPFDYGDDGSKMAEADYTAAKASYAKAGKMAKSIERLFGKFYGVIYGGEALSNEVLGERLEAVAAIWGYGGDFKKKLAQFNRDCNTFGFSIVSTQKKRVGGKQVRTGYTMAPCPNYEAIRVRLGHEIDTPLYGQVLVHKAIWRLALPRINAADYENSIAFWKTIESS